MFSNRSVSVQPSAPAIEYAFVPEARSVLAAVSSSGQVLGGLTPAFLNALRRVPHGRLVGALEDHAVELPRVRAERDPGRRVVLRHRRLDEVERLDRLAGGELLDEAGLPDRREIGRIAAGDRGGEDRGRVVAARGVLHRDVRELLLEAVEDELEVLLLRPGPDADEREIAAHGRLRVGCAARRRGEGGECDERGAESEHGGAQLAHRGSFQEGLS